MTGRFSRLPSEDVDEGRYYHNRQSLDLTESVSYDDFRRQSDSESVKSLIHQDNPDVHREKEKENNSAPLRQTLKEYSTLVWWLLAMSSVILYAGYDSAILGQINSMYAFQRDLGEWSHKPTDEDPDNWENVIPAVWMSIWSGIGPLGAMAGALLGGWFMDRWGRRFCLMIGGIIGAGAVVILMLCNKPEDKDTKRIMVLVGKIIQGVGLGILKIETYTYLSEIVPVSLKGSVMSLVPIMTLVGQLVGAVIVILANKNETSTSYQIALASQWAFAIPPVILAIFVPEAPSFLLKTKKDPQGALKSFTRLLGPKHNPRAALAKLQETLDEENKIAAKTSYLDCFKAADRHRTLIVMFAGSMEFFFGLPLLGDISYLLQQIGMDHSKSFYFVVAGLVIGLIANIGSTWTVTHFGRRKLTITSLLIAAGLWGVMGFSGIKQYDFTAWLAGGLATAIVIVCGLGCWPASYAIMGEVSSISLRSRSQGLANLSGSVTTVIMNAVLPFLYNPDALDLGAKIGFVQTGLAGVGALLTYFFVPELRGRSALEIDHLFEKKISSIGSTSWRDTHVEEVPLKHTQV